VIWMGITDIEGRVWRNFHLGKHVDLLMLDTRQYDRSIGAQYSNEEYIAAIAEDAGRTLMGARQESWFYRTLTESAVRGATWRVIGSQIVFSRVNLTNYPGLGFDVNVDAWDGYVANRNRTMKVLVEGGIGNNVLLAGDSVSFLSGVVWDDGGGGEWL
jgi:alkaline phosphatase D